MNQHRERAQRKERDAARALKERPARVPRPGYGEDSYPDPPGNDEFDSFDESFQLRCVAKFERGVALTLKGNAIAKAQAGLANHVWLKRSEARKAEARRVAQLHLDRLTREQRQYRSSRSDILDKARRSVRT